MLPVVQAPSSCLAGRGPRPSSSPSAVASCSSRCSSFKAHQPSPFSSPAPRPTYHAYPSKRVVLRRTSEFWYEEEEEFDGVAGELLLPKAFLVVGLPEASTTADAAAALAPATGIRGDRLAAGFSSTQLQGAGAALWGALGANRAPYFKKMRTREVLDTLDGARTPQDVASATEALMSEMLGQNWRVELDYGLGSELAPREEVLLVCSRGAAGALLQGLGSTAQLPAAGPVLLRVETRGWNTDVKPEDMKPLGSWKDLTPNVVSCSALGSTVAA